MPIAIGLKTHENSATYMPVVQNLPLLQISMRWLSWQRSEWCGSHDAQDGMAI
jgi:hypothetical protein